MKNIVLSLSGGLDSTSLLLYYLNKQATVYAISFDYGQKHKLEIELVQKNINFLLSNGFKINHQIIDISSINQLLYSSLTTDDIQTPNGYYSDENMKITVVPNRNAIFSSIIYGYALSIAKKINEQIYISLGVHSGDHAIYPDCRQDFFDTLYKAFNIGNWDSHLVNILLPYINFNKTDILKSLIDSCKNLNIDYKSILSNTNTCYKPNELGESCGICGSCQERKEAFDNLNLQDVIKYYK